MTTSAQRVASYRARQKAAGQPDSSRRNRGLHKKWARFEQRFDPSRQKPFVGCDGEGAGCDDLGRQLYLLFRMGSRELFTGSHLSTEEILDFICDDDSGGILVGFSFGYDVTMILRDLPESQLRRLLQPKESGPGKSRYTYFKRFDIEYLPKNYFRVRRVTIDRADDDREIRKVEKNSVRTIYETFGFFQKSFVKVIEEFDCGTELERTSIALDKSRRANFLNIGPRERQYCALECKLLAELMEKLRSYCHEANIRPRTWNGAGKLATALHNAHNTPRAKGLEIPPEVMSLANMAYYGGRFEITRTGLIGQKVYEYDIQSAYPAALVDLPCLLHGTWRSFKGQSSQNPYIAHVHFSHEQEDMGQLCGLPIRSKEGHLFWPVEGRGTYWSHELEAAKALGASIKTLSGYEYVKRCDCRQFDWVEELFEYRRRIGKSGPGYPIKLGINSLYGMLAQRVGAAAYQNMIWAGLITAITRSRIMRAAALAPGAIAMIATDGIYSLEPLALDIGPRLGQWELQELQDLFIVQPGLYWSPDKRKRKSRGLSQSFFERPGITEGFEDAFAQWLQSGGQADFPVIPVAVRNFIGLKIALARGKPDLAGTWLDENREISFDYRNKREGHYFAKGHIITNPKPGGRDCISLPHKDFLSSGGQEPWEKARAMLEDQPDYIDLSPPFQD